MSIGWMLMHQVTIGVKELNGCTVTSVFYVLQDFTCQNMNFTDKSFFKFTLHCFFMFVESADMNM